MSPCSMMASQIVGSGREPHVRAPDQRRGSGVGRATYFGHKIALQMLGDRQGRTAFDDLPFKTRPFYNGYPWFVPFVLRWHALIDRLGR